MQKNIGKIDRLLRIGAGAAIALLYFSGILSATILVGLAAIFLITSIAGICPLYGVCGISTRRK
jgi:amino acid transporter